MCRFIVYKGTERYLAEGLIRPANSLIQQSHHAREMPEQVNGDGFGVGWYSDGPDPTPCLFTSLTPAWSDRNLRRLAVRIRSSCFFAHVRAATTGGVSEQNCHPFRFGRFLWMHNGRIAGFKRILRRLRDSLREDLYQQLNGTSDSEHAFYVFLDGLTEARENARRALELDRQSLDEYQRDFFDMLHDPQRAQLDTAELADLLVDSLGEFPAAMLQRAMHETLDALCGWTRAAGVAEVSHYNFALTDGRTIIVTRYSDRAGVEPPSLYFSRGLELDDAHGRPGPAVVISSEPLNDLHDQWHAIPANHMLTVHGDHSLELCPVKLAAMAFSA